MAGNKIARSNRRIRPAIAGLICVGFAVVCPAAEEPAYRGPVKSLVPNFSDPGGRKSSGNGLDFLTPNSSLGPMIDTPMIQPPPTPRTPLTREKKEAIDRQKNWIFVTPQNSNETPEALLGVRKEKILTEEKEFKGVMQSYMEKDKKNGKDDKDKDERTDRKNDQDSSSRTNSTEKSRDQLDPGQDEARFGLKSDPLPDPLGREDKRARKDSKDREDNKDGSSRSGVQSVFSRGDGDSSTGRIASPFELERSSFLSSGSSVPVKKTEEQKAWANEFKQMLEGRALPGEHRSGSGFGDPINAPLQDASRQPMNPTVGSSGDFMRPSETRSSFDTLNRPGGMEGISRPATMSDMSTKMLGTSSLSPAVIAPPQPTVFVQPKPMVLEIPRRKF